MTGDRNTGSENVIIQSLEEMENHAIKTMEENLHFVMSFLVMVSMCNSFFKFFLLEKRTC